MDFGTLLHTAQKYGKNEKKEPVRYYSTKFEPPKKEQRSKQLSVNVKKFLAKKEAEEKLKQKEANKKRDELLALRAQDKKATRRVNVMLKRTKSANQSAIDDAIDTDNTSVTLAGPAQPDEDDYGYVSQEAAAFYNKMMEKYSKMPDEPKFNLNKKKKISTNLNNTKDRVRAALEREKEEASMPHKRKRKNKDTISYEDSNNEQEEVSSQIVKKPKQAAPPPINFAELLKIAEKKQFEPIVIEQKPKEEEKLLTKKQKKELEREKEWRERKEAKFTAPPDKSQIRPPNAKSNENNNNINNNNNNSKAINSSKINSNLNNKKVISSGVERKDNNVMSSNINDKKMSVNNSKVDQQQQRNNVPSRNLSNKSINSNSKITNNLVKNSREQDLKRPKVMLSSNDNNNKSLRDQQIKKIPPNNSLKPKQFPPRDLMKPKQFPPADVRTTRAPEFPGRKKPMVANKRRILDDDDEEYDSEMDDFIDDGPEEGEDYSKHINEIFGYDKSKYRYVDDDVDNMESTFAQQMREEVISSKIGRMEDLEDMKQEEEEKRRKMLMKKKMKL